MLAIITTLLPDLLQRTFQEAADLGLELHFKVETTSLQPGLVPDWFQTTRCIEST